MPFDGDAAQHQVDLVVGVAVALEVFDDAEAGLAVGDSGVHVVLLAVLVDGEAFEVDHAAGGELAGPELLVIGEEGGIESGGCLEGEDAAPIDGQFRRKTRSYERDEEDSRLDRTRDINRALPSHHSKLLLAIFDHVEFNGDDPGDFDRAAEGDFAVALCSTVSLRPQRLGVQTRW